jgi:SAM-dependent methyltransferase
MPRLCRSACDVCGAETEWRFAIRNRRDPLLRLVGVSRADFWVCQRCGLVRQIPKPPAVEAQRVYQKTEFRPESAEDARRGSVLARTVGDQYRWVMESRGVLQTGTVFDVGCGTGALLDEFRAAGWQTFGIEPTAHFAEYAASLGHTVTTGFLNGSGGDETFDLVTTSHVLEHVPDPRTFLQAVRRRMHQNSWLFVEVPDVMRPYGHIWLLFFSVNHLYHYNASTLTRLLRNQGFHVTAVENGQRGVRALCRLDSRESLAVPAVSPDAVLESIRHYRDVAFVASYFREGIKDDLKLIFRRGAMLGERIGDRIYDTVRRAVRPRAGHSS